MCEPSGGRRLGPSPATGGRPPRPITARFWLRWRARETGGAWLLSSRPPTRRSGGGRAETPPASFSRETPHHTLRSSIGAFGAGWRLKQKHENISGCREIWSEPASAAFERGRSRRADTSVGAAGGARGGGAGGGRRRSARQGAARRNAPSLAGRHVKAPREETRRHSTWSAVSSPRPRRAPVSSLFRPRARTPVAAARAHAQGGRR